MSQVRRNSRTSQCSRSSPLPLPPQSMASFVNEEMHHSCFSSWLSVHLESLESIIINRYENEMQVLREHNEILKRHCAQGSSPSMSLNCPVKPTVPLPSRQCADIPEGVASKASHGLLLDAAHHSGKAVGPVFKCNRSTISSSGTVMTMANDLWPDWRVQRSKVRRSTRRRGPNVVQDQTAEYLETRKKTQVHITKLQPGAASLKGRNSHQVMEEVVKSVVGVSSPTSMRRLCWDCLGLLMIWMDILVLPLQTFDVRRSLIIGALEMTSVVYWTLDIPASLTVGFYRSGEVEMRFRKVAVHYLRTWLCFDVVLVLADWLTYILRSAKPMGIDDTGYLRLSRFARYLRMMRLLRLLKVRGKLGEVTAHIQSETCRIALGIAGLLCLIITANHILACGFWALGKIRYDGASWIDFFEMKDATVLYQYSTSLHWSLTQFTPASMEITPKNGLERSYTVLVLLIAMIVFSSFVSSLTASTNRLRNLNRDREQSEMLLRRYLKDNKISTLLSSLIYGWVEAHTNRRDRIRAQDIAMIQYLPRRLRTALEEEVYRPNMINYPFFFQLEEVHPLAMPKIYRCMEEKVLKIGFELFAGGDLASHMFFITSGTLQYHRFVAKGSVDLPDFANGGSLDVLDVLCPQEVVTGGWLSEHSLWMRWSHQGTAVAASDCLLHAIPAAKFQEAMQKEHYRAWQISRFADMFFRDVANQPSYEWSDMAVSFDVLQERAQLAFTSGADPADNFGSADSDMYTSTEATPTNAGVSSNSSTFSAKFAKKSKSRSFLGSLFSNDSNSKKGNHPALFCSENSSVSLSFELGQPDCDFREADEDLANISECSSDVELNTSDDESNLTVPSSRTNDVLRPTSPKHYVKSDRPKA